MGIFRQEALDYQCRRLSGTVALKVDKTLRLHAVLFVVVAAACLAAFACADIVAATPVPCAVQTAGTVAVTLPAAARAPGRSLDALHLKVGQASFTIAAASTLDGLAPVARIAIPPDIVADRCGATAHLRVNLAQLIMSKILRNA